MTQIAVSWEAVLHNEPELLQQLKKPKVHSPLAGKILENNLKLLQLGRLAVVVSVSRQTPQPTLPEELKPDTNEYQAKLRRTARRAREEKLLEAIKRMQLPPKDHDLIYLPQKSLAAEQLVKHAHFQTAHGSANRMLVEIHKRFWIPRARSLAKRNSKNCHLCKLRNAKLIKVPEAPLPRYRTMAQRAFQTIGVDFTKSFPPITGMNGNTCILVITCTFYRITILVPTIGQSYKSFLYAFDTFRNTRSAKPDLIVSDSAGAFQLAYKELKKRIQDEYLAWKFNLPRTPWWGGFFERLMRIIEDHMTALFEKFQFSSVQQFIAAVALLERLINSRPILEVYDDREDVPTTITPNQFLNPQAEENFNIVLDDMLNKPVSMEPQAIEELLVRSRDQTEFYQRLIRTFQDQYFLTLRKFHNTPMYTRPTAYQLKVGDVVLIKPEFDFKPGAMRRKLLWPRGRITELIKTVRDNIVRAVKVRVRLPNKTIKEVGPIAVQKIAPLEIIGRSVN
jgi:hypothetical protein